MTPAFPFGLIAASLALSSADVPTAPPWTGPSDLVEIVPPDTTYFWSWRSGEETALVEERAFSIVDALCEARFDEFAFDAMTELGVDPGVVVELRGVRNLFVSLAGVVPWRELVRNELVYAESNGSGRLIACRPDPARFDEIERGLAGLLGSAATLMLGPVRYDITTDEYSGTRSYSLSLRGETGSSLMRIAVGHGTVLFGTNEHYFQAALGLLEGGDGHRLIDAPRYVEAYGELDYHAPGRTYIDMRMLSDDLDQIADFLGEREFQAGFVQGMLNGVVDLADSVETIVTTTQCVAYEVSTETWTRFDASSSDMVRAGLATPASAALMNYVPADVVSFDMRGDVDPRPVLNWLKEQWKADWAPAEDMLWVTEVIEAFMGMSLEHDVLSWLGSEQVSMVIPHRKSKRNRGWTEDVMICRVRDPEGTRKVLERVEGIFEVLAPPLIEKIQGVMQQANLPFSFNMTITPARGDFPELRKLRIVAFPLPIPPMNYGMVDDMFVFASSTQALESCLEVARGERAGLGDHLFARGLAGRTDLCSARLRSAGQAVDNFSEMLKGVEGPLQQVHQAIAQQENPSPEALRGIELAVEFLARVDGVLGAFDFLGDAITTSEERLGGLARYESTTIQIGRMPIEIPTSEEDKVAMGER